MKQKDLAVIILAVGMSAIFSYFVASFLFSSKEKRTMQVEVVDPISAEFAELDDQYFNKDSINPTKRIKIGGQQNTQPFEEGQ